MVDERGVVVWVSKPCVLDVLHDEVDHLAASHAGQEEVPTGQDVVAHGAADLV